MRIHRGTPGCHPTVLDQFENAWFALCLLDFSTVPGMRHQSDFIVLERLHSGHRNTQHAISYLCG